MVMILPALKEIMHLYPDAHLHLITSPDGQRLFKSLNFPIANLLVYRNHAIYKYKDSLVIKRFIKDHRFDKIFCFEQKKRTQSWLPPEAELLQPSPQITHYALRCLSLVNPKLHRSHAIEYISLNMLSRNDFNVVHPPEMNKTYTIGIHPTYSGYNKIAQQSEKKHRLWPTENFAHLINKLQAYAEEHEIPIQIFINLLKQEAKIAQKIAKNSKHFQLIIGSADFSAYIYYLKTLDLLITPNTGVMHLAAGLNTPLIALFSKYSPEDCGPYMPEENFKIIESQNLRLGLKAIEVDRVFVAVKAHLERQQSLEEM